MTEKKYINHSVEELVHDQEFVSAVKSINTSEEWDHFVQSQTMGNDSGKNIIQAREIIQLFQTKESHTTGISYEKRLKLWNTIHRFNNRNSESHKVLTIFVRIAASMLIIISLGGLLYFHFDRFPHMQSRYQFSELKNGIKTDKPLLVLSNGTKIELEKRESKITVLKDQDAIQINNDSIVKSQTSTDQNRNDVKYNEVIIPFGEKSKLVLEDGTIVWLNAGSRFAFPSKFNGKKREVILDGEAYFEVARNTKQPFIVSAGPISIEVIGTRFNANAYTSDNLSETVLLEGKVNIWDNGKLFKDKVAMVPFQKATYDKTGKMIVLLPELEPEKTIAWVEGWYEFKNEKLEVIFKKLERYYNVRFQYDPIVIARALPVSGKLDLKKSLNDVLLVLSRVAKFDYQISGNIINIKNSIKKQPMKN